MIGRPCLDLLATSTGNDCVHRRGLFLGRIRSASTSDSCGPLRFTETKFSVQFSVVMGDGILSCRKGRGEIVSSTVLFFIHSA